MSFLSGCYQAILKVILDPEGWSQWWCWQEHCYAGDEYERTQCWNQGTLIFQELQILGIARANNGMLLFYLSGQNEKERQLNNESEKAFVKTKEYVWSKNKDYVGGATCWSSIDFLTSVKTIQASW